MLYLDRAKLDFFQRFAVGSSMLIVALYKSFLFIK
jgi:hypothetical protein